MVKFGLAIHFNESLIQAQRVPGTMEENIDLKKMYWHSRRGMLELDLILVPFAEKVLPGLSAEEKLSYADLLEEEDQDLFLWLVRGELVPDDALKGIIATVLSSA